MPKLQAITNPDGSIRLVKSYAALADENAELAKTLDYITKEELISAIKQIAAVVGVEVSFTYDQLKNTI